MLVKVKEQFELVSKERETLLLVLFSLMNLIHYVLKELKEGKEVEVALAS